MTRFLFALAALLFLGAAGPPALDQLHRADGALLVPDRFLRAWDPITVFFDHDAGPAAGGPEDAPEQLLTLAPPQPGAWTWLGARTLQFRPAEAWTPLRRETVTLGARSATLVPLLPVPVSTALPDDGGDRFALTFDGPVDIPALTRLLSIELRPAPGISAEGGQTLTAPDFSVQAADRGERKDRQTYLVVLRQPIPDDRVAILRLRLSDEPGLDDPMFELRTTTATPFGVTDLLCADGFQHEAQDGMVRCTEDGSVAGARRGILLQFSADPELMDIVRARQVLRFSPPVEDLALPSTNAGLQVTGRFQAGVVYELRLDDSLHDRAGRTLQGETAARRFTFVESAPALRWDADQGIVERFGPQMLPLHGHGYNRADIRIHPIDPLSRDFWPFPAAVTTQDGAAPPLPGNEPQPWKASTDIEQADIQARIAALGSPAISDLVDLPIQRGGTDAKFGIDVAPLLTRIAGAGQPGAYLVGLRPVDGANRTWLRIQVTDLSLTAVEEPERVRFAVTSLATARPVADAEVRLEGLHDDKFVTLERGVTGADGFWSWAPPARTGNELRRVVVTKGADQLVLEPGRASPPRYAEGAWSAHPQDEEDHPWLGWAADGAIAGRQEPPRLLCHVFTERPIYRPEEPVLVAGMVRRWDGGSLAFAGGSGTAVITGPDDEEYKIPVALDDVGGFHARFDEKTEATGDYKLSFVPDGAEACGDTSFKKEAYRLPTFEVLLNGPAHAALDTPFSVGLAARWFAGGMLSARPVTWRVTQFPYAWTPPGREGFDFSSDSRFANDTPFRSTSVLTRAATTDAGGGAQLALDPTIEPTAQPREYVVEATVTGDDDIQVRSTQHVVALPPFVLGIRQPRYLDHAGAIEPDIIAIDADGKPLAGLPITLRLIHRNWNSVLQASDFAQGSAKYQTESIDETVEERHLVSGEDALHEKFDVKEAGVYVVEAEASDRIGRAQRIRVDLFMAGDTPVTWSRPPSQTVTVSSDKDSYAPGDTAALVVQSPFQNGRALAVTEQPEGTFDYQWADIADGFARLAVPVRKQQVPKLAVHVLLMRGRLPGVVPTPTAPFDQGKPVTLAATTWVRVVPIENEVKVRFDAPATARPAQTIDVTLHLADAAGKPLAGEATFWMVDQAVLSLAKEHPLDPLPAFIVERPATLVARDSRNMAFGILPLIENPGGDEGGDLGMENISVRRNFTPVPIYVPRVKFGADGTAVVHVKLPDSLTVYMLRAKAISGPDRFGAGSGQLRIRQPIVAQPALPRFVRPGDRFDASVIARVVEGPGGAAHALLSIDGLNSDGAKEQAFGFGDTQPGRIEFPVTVPQPAPGKDVAHVRFLVQRDADHASDALEIALPIHPDRPVVHDREVFSLAPGGTLDVPASVATRPGSYARTVTAAADPVLVKLIGGLRTLAEYPHGCTEQRMSLAASELALSPFAPILEAAGVKDRVATDVAATILAIRQTTDEDGLVAFWPRTRGSVTLTAWTYRFLIAAKQAGEPVDPAMLERFAKVLTQALRSDYPRFVAGEALRERVEALTALAAGGKLSADYTAELSRRALLLPTDALAQVAGAVATLPTRDPRLFANLMQTLWGRVQVLARNGQPVYGGLSDIGGSAFILPSETRALAEVLHTVAGATPDEPRLKLLRTALVTLGDGDGWGTTNATAAALRALATSWAAGTTALPVALTLPDRSVAGTLDGTTPLLSGRTGQEGPVRAANHGGAAVALLVDSVYMPAEPGAAAKPVQHGFVLSRTLYRVPASGPMQRLDPGADGAVHLAQGDVVEEADEVVNPEPRAHVAITLPLPAGFEPLNPNLATAPAEAAPSAGPTLEPSYASFVDDAVTFVYLDLPKGTFTLRFRDRAQVAGSFTEPPAQAEAMYQPGVTGASGGLRVDIARP